MQLGMDVSGGVAVNSDQAAGTALSNRLPYVVDDGLAGNYVSGVVKDGVAEQDNVL